MALRRRILVGQYDSWGGPALAGAWAVHALGGLGFRPLVAWLLRGYAAPWPHLAGRTPQR
ncbi:hypothetical protein GCM10010170_059160 [Dactylosporangium salmoneum]|uniref:Uncharacterized protein n=2 Tax=Dactylosporangium salmoneum TaxID=53361 RepID=A0ABP5TYY1_9ACTN